MPSVMEGKGAADGWGLHNLLHFAGGIGLVEPNPGFSAARMIPAEANTRM